MIQSHLGTTYFFFVGQRLGDRSEIFEIPRGLQVREHFLITQFNQQKTGSLSLVWWRNYFSTTKNKLCQIRKQLFVDTNFPMDYWTLTTGCARLQLGISVFNWDKSH